MLSISILRAGLPCCIYGVHGGLEPPTDDLEFARSDQLSYADTPTYIDFIIDPSTELIRRNHRISANDY